MWINLFSQVFLIILHQGFMGIISIFLDSTMKYSLTLPIHDDFIKLEGISSLTYRIYLFFCYFGRVTMGLKNGNWASWSKEWNVVLKITNKSTISRTISLRSYNLFLTGSVLIFSVTTFSSLLKFRFFTTLFSSFVSLDICVFRMILVEIDWFFAVENIQYAVSTFVCMCVFVCICVWVCLVSACVRVFQVLKQYRMRIVNKNYFTNIHNSELI